MGGGQALHGGDGQRRRVGRRAGGALPKAGHTSSQVHQRCVRLPHQLGPRPLARPSSAPHWFGMPAAVREAASGGARSGWTRRRRRRRSTSEPPRLGRPRRALAAASPLAGATQGTTPGGVPPGGPVAAPPAPHHRVLPAAPTGLEGLQVEAQAATRAPTSYHNATARHTQHPIPAGQQQPQQPQQSPPDYAATSAYRPACGLASTLGGYTSVSWRPAPATPIPAPDRLTLSHSATSLHGARATSAGFGRSRSSRRSSTGPPCPRHPSTTTTAR